MSNFSSVFRRQFPIATHALKINRSDPYAERNVSWKLQVFWSYFVSVTCLLFLVNSIILHDFPGQDYSEGVKNGMIVIVSTSILIKFYILTHHRDALISLFEIIENDYEEAKTFSDHDKSIIQQYIKKGKDICKIWLIIALGASIMFPLKAIVFMIYYYRNGEFRLVLMFDMHYPDIINDHKFDPVIYFLLTLLIFSFDSFAMSMYIAFDPLVPIFMLHMCGQLHLLSQKIMDVFSSSNTPEEITENLKHVNIKLESIYRFVKKVQDIFTAQYEFNLKTTTFLIPFAAFQIVQSLRNREFNLEFLFFFVGAILHFYIPCFYSDLLMEKSWLMREAIYSSSWENNANKQNRKTILFMLTRTTKPLVIRTIFYSICLNTFAEMCRQSYAIYNIINAAWG